jgi:hypothetical protein
MILDLVSFATPSKQIAPEKLQPSAALRSRAQHGVTGFLPLTNSRKNRCYGGPGKQKAETEWAHSELRMEALRH